jgi:hypothetical protein
MAPSDMSLNAGGGKGVAGVSANEYSCAHGPQINFEDRTPYLINGWEALRGSVIFNIKVSVSQTESVESMCSKVPGRHPNTRTNCSTAIY